MTDATGFVFDETGAAIQGALVTLFGPSDRQTQTDASGAFLFRTVPVGTCTIQVERPGFLVKQGTLSCPFTGLEVRLTRASIDDTPTPTPIAVDDEPAAVLHELQGVVLDRDTGAPVRGALWNIDRSGKTLADGRTGPEGIFSAKLEPGPLVITVEAPCRPALVHRAELVQSLELEIYLNASSAGAPPAAPLVQGHPGPGTGMITLTWNAVESAARYEVSEGRSILDLGGALAWGDHTPSGDYRVRAINICGAVGPWSDARSPAPSSGGDLPGLATVQSDSPTVHERQYDVLDANGTVVATKAWRIIEGTGNCCENYVSTTRQGWILDFGGSSLRFSKDEGVTWSRIVPHSIQICGEGAVVPGPGGDIYAMNWEMCLGAGTDGVWTLKYVAADDVWLEGAGPAHAPFFDRPWMTVMTGPHLDALGQVGPVRSYIFTNVNDNLYGQGNVVSSDGVVYLPQPPLSDSLLGEDLDLPSALLPDPDADWAQPLVASFARSLDAGLGVLDVGLTCQILDTADGRGCNRQTLPVRSMQRDGGGRLHEVEFTDTGFLYRTSDDVGRSWDRHPFSYPPGVQGILEWDLKAHDALDRSVVAIHAQVEGGAVDYAIVLRDIRDTPTIDRVLRVGASAGTSDSGVAAEGDRYDFMSTGFLPDGRVVLSMTDGEFHPPAVAVELK